MMEILINPATGVMIAVIPASIALVVLVVMGILSKLKKRK